MAVLAVMMLESAFAQQSQPTIRQIQQTLTDRGYSIGVVDGLWGRRSINALAAFQKAEGIPSTGELDRATISRLIEPRGAAHSKPAPPSDVEAPLPLSPQPGDQVPQGRQETEGAAAAPTSPPTQSPARPTAPPAIDPSVHPQRERLSDPISPVSDGPLTSAAPLPPVATADEPSGPNSGLILSALIGIVGALLILRRRSRTIGKQHQQPEDAIPRQEPRFTTHPAKPLPPAARVSPPLHSAKAEVRSPDPVVGERGSLPASSEGWVPRGQRVTLGKQIIDGGFIYVGRYLPQQRQSQAPDNCLIDPRLPVSSRGDPAGHSMGYWPSYSSLSAEARKSYLDWLAGSRDDPATYIGYVFLYFYGLERRLMLGPVATDEEEIVAEVFRLLEVYGSSGSFHRYASALLGAHALRSSLPPEVTASAADDRVYEVPLQIKAALGARVRDGQPIEPDLLLAYVMSHPETKVRTPARRAFEQLRQLFAEALAERYPAGLRIAAGRAKTLKTTYTACSSTFTVDIRPYGGDLPDITGRSEPLSTGRALFERCVEQLEDYSRAIGRSAGMQPTLAVLARLPAGRRWRGATGSAETALLRIASLAESGTPMAVRELGALAGLGDEPVLGKARLRTLASTLAAFGFGMTADPAFAVKIAQPEEAAIVFPLGQEAETDLLPSEAYRGNQVALMLGMLVAMIDGHLDETERRSFVRRIDADAALSGDERSRLRADLVIQERQPMPIVDVMKRIKDLPEDDRAGLADMLVAAAAADGRVDASEVSLLERLFRRLGLDEASIYTRLHAGLAASSPRADDDLTLVIPPEASAQGLPIPPPIPRVPPRPAGRVDLSRLEAIRMETLSASSMLASIFVDPEEEAPETAAPIDIDDDIGADAHFDGLDRRYGTLVIDLRDREQWLSVDFEQLCRIAGLMPGAARQVLNDWALDQFDELLLEGEDPIYVNVQCLPLPAAAPSVHPTLNAEPRVSA